MKVQYFLSSFNPQQTTLAPMAAETAFVFSGDWNFSVKLDAFRDFNRYEYSKALEGEVWVKIVDAANNDPDPTPAQLRALNCLVKYHEVLILQLFDTLRLSYLEWSEYTQIPLSDTFSFPPLYSIEDLEKNLEIVHVEVSLKAKDDYSYVMLYADPPWDEEHGFAFVIHKNKVLGYGCYEDLDGFINEDAESCELDSDRWDLDFQLTDIVDIDTEEPEIPDPIFPHPKYGKLKPWQELSNGFKERVERAKLSRRLRDKK